MVASTLEPRASSGGRLGKKRTSELTVRTVGPEDLPAVSFSSGKTRITIPAGRYAGHSAPLACAATAHITRQKKTAVRTKSEFIFILLARDLQKCNVKATGNAVSFTKEHDNEKAPTESHDKICDGPRQ